MVSRHMSQGDLNSNLLPNTTFPIVENYAQKKFKKTQKNQKNSKKSKKSEKIKKILNSNLNPTIFVQKTNIFEACHRPMYGCLF